MQIQINTGHNIDGRQALSTYIKGVVENALTRFTDHISRVEVHLNDEKGEKTGQHPMRCMIEARLEGRQPVAVTEHAATLEKSVERAADKLVRMLDKTFGRKRDQQRQRSTSSPNASSRKEQA